MRIFITGINGFVGNYLVQYLQKSGHLVSGIGQGEMDIPGVQYEDVNILDKPALEKVIRETKPDWVFHLSGIASVQYSWLHPAETIKVNVLGTINLLEVLAGSAVKAIVIVGSSEVYGPGRHIGEMFNEEHGHNPQSPYATSKCAAESMAMQLGKMHKLPIIAVRPFNHIGVRQKLGFAVPDFAREIIEAKINKKSIRVGYLDVYRDFTDVRDVVRAYAMLADKGKAGEIYNICSGKANKMSDILDMMRTEYGNPEILIDENKFRPSENVYSVGDNTKIRMAVGWEPEISIEESLQAVLQEWENRLSAKYT